MIARRRRTTFLYVDREFLRGGKDMRPRRKAVGRNGGVEKDESRKQRGKEDYRKIERKITH